MQPACNDNASSNWILPYIATLRNFLRQRETRSIVVVATTYSLISRFRCRSLTTITSSSRSRRKLPSFCNTVQPWCFGSWSALT